MRRMIVACACGALACGPKTPKADVDPATDAEARTFVTTLLATPQPCDETVLDPLIDRDAMTAAFAERTHLDGRKRDAMSDVLAKRHSGAKILCAWVGTPNSEYKLLSVAGAHPIVRKLITEAPGKVGVTYYKLTLGKSRSDGIVRIVDAYSYLEGAWLTEMLSQTVDTAMEHGDPFVFSRTIKRVKELRVAGKPAEAIAELGKLTPEMQQLRYIRLMRIGLAKQVGQADYLRELDDLARAFPNDPTVALIEIDAAALHGDFDAALRYVDVVDKEVGGDPFQDTVRASLYLKKHDVASAAAHVDAAIKAEPTLARAWFIDLDVLMQQKDWARALDVIDKLATLGHKLTDDGMHKVHTFDDLLATPEYAAWHAQHP